MTEDTPTNASRRTFIKGVIAAGAAVSSASYLFRTTSLSGQSSAPGSVERLITLNVNGQDRRVDVMKQETLAMTLRYKLGLTGTKLGCDRSECGACTVLIDDNVHVANTLQFVHELQKAEKPFQLMLYPKTRHGVTDPALVKHLRTTMLDFVLRHLSPGE